MTRRLRHALPALAAASLILAACGGGDADDASGSEAPAPDADEPDESDEPDETESADDDSDVASAPVTTDAPAGTEAPTTTEPAATFTPGDISYRFVNLSSQTYDLYSRTTGLVEAFPVQMGLGPDTVSDLVYLPEGGGAAAVLEAGADDPTCVSTCDHILGTWSPFDGTGNEHIVVIHEADGEVDRLELYENTVERQGRGNELPEADPNAATVMIHSVAVSDFDFGGQISIVGQPGCQTYEDGTNLLLGGFTTKSYTYNGEINFTIHDNQDSDCDEAPVGGPFKATGEAGSRLLVLLSGSPGAMTATFITTQDSPPAEGGEGSMSVVIGDDDPSGDDTGEDASAETPAPRTSDDPVVQSAYDQMAVEAAVGLGITDEQAACVSPYLVDVLVAELGIDGVMIDGELVDLDSLDASLEPVVQTAMLDAVLECNIDPDSIG